MQLLVVKGSKKYRIYILNPENKSLQWKERLMNNVYKEKQVAKFRHISYSESGILHTDIYLTIHPKYYKEEA